MAADAVTILGSYFAAWNEPDARARATLLAAVVPEDVRVLPGYLPQLAPVIGLRAFSEHMGAVIASRPSRDVRLVQEGPVDGHHGWLRFAWRVLLAGGETFAPQGAEIAGIDVVRLTDDGRFAEIVIFMGQ